MKLVKIKKMNNNKKKILHFDKLELFFFNLIFMKMNSCSHIKFSHIIKIKAGSPGHFQNFDVT